MRAINFYLPKGQAESVTVRLKFTLNYNQINETTGIRVTRKNWDHKKKRLKISARNAGAINKALTKIEGKAQEAITRQLLEGRYTKDAFLNYFKDEDKKTNENINIFDFIKEQFIPHHQNKGVKNSTLKSYTSAMNKLKRYTEKKKKLLTIKKVMSYQFYLDYTGYLNLDCGHSLNYQGSQIKFLINVIHHAIKLGYTNEQLPQDYIKPTEKIGPIVLNKREIEDLISYKADSKTEEAAKDWFIISCLTGLRISDFFKLNDTHINLELNQIKIKTTKTGKTVTIPMATTVRDIINKYNGTPQKMAEQTFNKRIKEVCRKAGISDNLEVERKIKGRTKIDNYAKWEKVTAHTGRRTFATLAFDEGWLQPSEIMLITGHQDLKTLMIYVNQDQKKVSKKLMENMKSSGF